MLYVSDQFKFRLETNQLCDNSSSIVHYLHTTRTGTKVCFILSVSGVIFLSIIAYLLGQNSIYIKVNSVHRKETLAESVTVAAFLYMGCAVVSGYLWFRADNFRERREEDLRLLE
jgi:hypothetical protein